MILKMTIYIFVTIKISNLNECGGDMLYNPEYRAAALFPLRYFNSFHKIIKCNKNFNKVYSAASYDASDGTMSEKEQWLTSSYVLGNDVSLMH